MSIQRAALALLVFWSSLHGLKRVLRRRRRRIVLPWNLSRGRLTSRTAVSLQHVHLNLQTTSCNTLYDRFASLLASKQYKKCKTALSLFYNLGYFSAVLGMLGASIILFWTCCSIMWKMLVSQKQSTWTAHNYSKRDTTYGGTGSHAWSTIKPIIPGLTVPFSDLPIIFCAVFMTQIIHELGHAIAAAIENVPIQSIGASLSLIVPSASVAFAASALDGVTPHSRSIIVSAGPFHNLVFWLILSFLSKTNLDQHFWWLAYQDMGHMGRIVVDVTRDSVLNGYLLPGTLITHIDDVPMWSVVSGPGWTAALRRSHENEPKGWCVDYSLLSKSQNCCSRDMSSFSPLACFREIEGYSPLHGCLDPLTILAVPDGTRCSTISPCPARYICSRPDEQEQLLRLTTGYPMEKQIIILWSGPPDEIENAVTLGTLEPRFHFIPLSLPLLLTKFSRYLSLATLSLYFFNLLPIHPLDGHHLLILLLNVAVDGNRDSEEYDMEATTTPTGRRIVWTSRTKHLLLVWIPRTILGMLVLSSVLTLGDLQ
ncbi:hypothetical protein AX15_004867 [Amanita polypyramis BW_CC]|nr:hypothetical protein AX15_004867 [Amanita polypyramis BW_CC]